MAESEDKKIGGIAEPKKRNPMDTSTRTVRSDFVSKKQKYIDTSTRTVNSDWDVDEEDQHMKGILGIFYLIFFIALVAGGYYVITNLFHLPKLLNQHIDKRVLSMIGAVGVFVAGTILYFFRQHKRLLYAVVEIAFAIVTGGIAMRNAGTQEDLSVWIALVAAAYLVVRGMDNLQQGGFHPIDICNRFLSEHVLVPKNVQDISD